MTEGSFPKIDGDILYASEFNQSFDFLSIDLMYNLEAGNITLENAFINSTNTETDGSGEYWRYSSDTTYGIYAFGNIVDVFEDGSIDSDLWSYSGTVTETGGYIQLKTANTGDYLLLKRNYLTDDFTLIFKAIGSGSTSSGWAIDYYITDGTTDVDLGTIVSVTDQGLKLRRLVFDSTAKTVTVYNDDNGIASSGTSYDLSSLSSYYYLKFKVTNDADDSAYINIYWILDDYSSATATCETATAETIDTSKYGFGWYKIYVDNGNIPTMYVSSDNGTNYYESHNEWVETTSGTQAKVKLVQTITSAGGVYLASIGGWFKNKID